MFRIISTILRPTLQAVKTTVVPCNNMHSLSAVTHFQAGNHIVKAEPISIFSQVRNKVRCYFPRPNEVMRIRKHGWAKRLSTKEGRRIIMRRILKGRHVLSH